MKLPKEDDAQVWLFVLDGAVSASRFVTAWRQSRGSSSLVLAEGHAGTHIDQSVDEHVEHRLDAEGWYLPETVVGGGRHLGRPGESQPALWFEHFVATADAHTDRLQTVRSPHAIVATLEALLADGVVPTPDGWVDGATDRLGGDKDTIARQFSAIDDAVGGFDHGTAMASIDRPKCRVFARDALVSYLEWSLDAGIATPGIKRVAASASSGGPSVEDVLLVAPEQPTSTAVDAGWLAAERSLHVAIPALPSALHRQAWPRSAAAIADQLADRTREADIAVATVRAEDPSVAVERVVPRDDRPRSALIESNSADAEMSIRYHDDPVARAVDTIEDWLDDGHPAIQSPDDLQVVVTDRRDARRLMRLVATRDLPLARTGRVEPTKTRIGVLARAWLRVIEGIRPDRGWAVILETAGCSAGDLEAWLDGDERPSAFASLRGALAECPDGPSVIAAVAERYGADPRATHALLSLIGDTEVPPSRAETLERLAVAAGQSVTLEPATTAHGSVQTQPPSSASPVVLHVESGRTDSDPALVYRPPLGVQFTRELRTIDGYAVEAPDASWMALEAVRPDQTDRRRWRAHASAARATAAAVVIAAPPQFGLTAAIGSGADGTVGRVEEP